ncbi:MAG TPA: two-component regulator propeller domain-containing protein [Puia sp.]|nr:two-component regulator propeller domain-containing protein [Puia sp.]
MLFISGLRASDGPPVTYLGIEQGLSNNSVTCVFQDHKGFMWFGTYDGLNRYDGYNFYIFRNRLTDANSLPNNRIASIVEDSSKRIWIGTRSGVARYDEVTSTFDPVWYIPSGEKKPKKITATVNQIKTDYWGNVLIGTDDGLFLYQEKTNVALPVFIDGDQAKHGAYQVLSVECDSKKNIWVYVREKGLYLYNSGLHTLKLVTAEIKNGIYLKADAGGNLWMGADDGLFCYSIAQNKFSKLFSCGNRIVHLSTYGSCMYIASDGNGVFTLDIPTKKTTRLFVASSRQKLTSVSTYDVLKDRDERLWIGTIRGGINVIDPERNKFRTIAHDPLRANSLIGNFVTGCCEDAEGDLWMGTDGNGLSCWNRKQNKFTGYRHQEQNLLSRSSNFITDVLIDYKNEIWVSSWGGGINRLDRQSRTFRHYNCLNTELGREDKNHFLLFQDSRNHLWAGSCLEGGLYCFNRQQEKFELYDCRLKNILAMYEDRRGKLWAGDFSSLILIDQIKKIHQRYQVGYAVRSILEDKNGNFWIGTEGAGLLLFDPVTGRFTRFSESDGLSNNSVLKILEDKRNNLWISTFNGISMFNTITRKFINFSPSDGLQSSQFSYNAGVKLRSGEFVFGGIKGLNIFYPDSIINNSRPLTVLLTGLTVDNQAIKENDSYIARRTQDRIERIKLPFDKAVLSVDFVALNYSASDKIKYAYYLEGWDKGWNYVGKTRTANYTRINEGSYVFHVKAKDASGNWSTSEEKLIIEILPPWYRTWWAYLLYIAISLAPFYLYVRYKSQRDRQAYEIALARIETEKQKELNEKKLSFFTNISHEFRAPLTLIIDPVKDLLHHPEKRHSAVGLNIVYRNARRLLSLVDQLLLFRKADAEGGNLKPVRVNFYELCQDVFICFSQQAKTRNVSYEFSCSNPFLELMADREKMEIILFNLLSNAIKFTPPGGRVTFKIIEDPKKPGIVEVEISDTGCGIEPGIGNTLFEKFYQVKNGQNTVYKGFGIGLYLVHQLVQAHKGTIVYESAIGKGTRFTLSLPANLPADDPEGPAEEIPEQVPERKPVLLEELIADLEADTAESVRNESCENLNPAQKTLPALPDFVSVKKSILLVDDNADIREYLSGIFNSRFLVYEAESGETGLKMAESYLPDIIISDIVMNGMTGVDFCHKIKADPELNHIPVILLTATTSSEIKLKGIECGAEDYITKPFEKELLIARVDNILRNRSTIQQYFLETVTLRKTKTRVSASYRNFLDRCIQVVEREINNENFTIKAFSRAMGMSHSSLYQKIKSVSGLSLNAFIRYLRLRKAALLLLSTDININEAAFQVGINDARYFRSQFHKLFGMNPSEYVKKYKETFNQDFNVVG